MTDDEETEGQTDTADTSEVTERERKWGVAAHLSALLMLLGIPFANILGPFAIWLFMKEDSDWVEEQARESMNFQISMTIYTVVAAFTILLLVGLLLVPLLILANLTLVIIASVKASDRESYSYPANLRLI